MTEREKKRLNDLVGNVYEFVVGSYADMGSYEELKDIPKKNTAIQLTFEVSKLIYQEIRIKFINKEIEILNENQIKKLVEEEFKEWWEEDILNIIRDTKYFL